MLVGNAFYFILLIGVGGGGVRLRYVIQTDILFLWPSVIKFSPGRFIPCIILYIQIDCAIAYTYTEKSFSVCGNWCLVIVERIVSVRRKHNQYGNFIHSSQEADGK